jgi:CTP synthase (UTP-ammonia lyase)
MELKHDLDLGHYERFTHAHLSKANKLDDRSNLLVGD